MAEIDKGLPNTRNKEEIPSQKEIQDVAVQEPVEEKGPVDYGRYGSDLCSCNAIHMTVQKLMTPILVSISEQTFKNEQDYRQIIHQILPKKLQSFTHLVFNSFYGNI